MTHFRRPRLSIRFRYIITHFRKPELSQLSPLLWQTSENQNCPPLLQHISEKHNCPHYYNTFQRTTTTPYYYNTFQITRIVPNVSTIVTHFREPELSQLSPLLWHISENQNCPNCLHYCDTFQRTGIVPIVPTIMTHFWEEKLSRLSPLLWHISENQNCPNFPPLLWNISEDQNCPNCSQFYDTFQRTRTVPIIPTIVTRFREPAQVGDQHHRAAQEPDGPRGRHGGLHVSLRHLARSQRALGQEDRQQARRGNHTGSVLVPVSELMEIIQVAC